MHAREVSLPSSVSISVMSPQHKVFGAIASNLRSTRSRAVFRFPGRVGERRRRGGLRPCRPSPAMMSTTVFCDTCQPSSHKSSVILGEP
ncbi:hypothetical protein AB0451_23725 [Streptomyces sp. NPDC052000]|uniref:hypothetical protein n=1 Tax=Streptomyces sp. NPDC052000 TaxID=3155676 RepID=UPI00344D996B